MLLLPETRLPSSVLLYSKSEEFAEVNSEGTAKISQGF